MVESGRVMRVRQDIIGNTVTEHEGVSEGVATVLKMLSWTPFMTLDEMAAVKGQGKTSTRKHISRAEGDGLVAHVLHGLTGRKGWRRYMLTGKGVETLAAVERARTAEVMGRPGATGQALATCHRRIDILAGVYQTAATVAACYPSPCVRVDIPRDGPLDGVVRMPDAPYSIGVMVKRHVVDDDYFGLKSWRYRVQMEAKPSALLVVAPWYLAEHSVQRRVQENAKTLFWITSLADLGDPNVSVWCESSHKDSEETFWSMKEVLERIPEAHFRDVEPVARPYKRGGVAPSRLGSPDRAHPRGQADALCHRRLAPGEGKPYRGRGPSYLLDAGGGCEATARSWIGPRCPGEGRPPVGPD